MNWFTKWFFGWAAVKPQFKSCPVSGCECYKLIPPCPPHSPKTKWCSLCKHWCNDCLYCPKHNW